jgi:NAD(P)-dependent dehydrogenase (short-subunit alcohol dehydrogenase family)
MPFQELEGGLRGRTALVTGASRGIGFEIARMLAGAGCRVAMVARGEDQLRTAAREVGGAAFPADVSDLDAVGRLRDAVTRAFGAPPDFLVSAAGAFSVAPLVDTDPAEFDRQLAMNLRAPFLVARAFLPAMLARGSGHVLNLGSVAGRVAFAGNSAYSAAKFGLRGMHEVLAEELRGSGVRATLVEPAATDTSIWDAIDLDRNPGLPARSVMLRPADVARAVLFALAQPDGVEIPLLSIRSGR